MNISCFLDIFVELILCLSGNLTNKVVQTVLFLFCAGEVHHSE